MQNVLAEIDRLPDLELYGRVTAVQGLMIEIGGLARSQAIGSRVSLIARGGQAIAGEIVGFRRDQAVVLPFGAVEGVGIGCKAKALSQQAAIYPDVSWLGRVIDARGEPIDGGPPLRQGPRAYPLRAVPPPAHARRRVGARIDLGVRALNTFVTCCRGQRMGVFAGSGVGKSILMSMMARYTGADVNVIGLVGERGREVQEFIEDDLGKDGLARSVLVVATSDEPALQRRQAAYLTMALAEFFRDLDLDVLCLMDSVTRFAMAQREIGLAGGEPPAAKGYTPTVFAELPKLLERAGPGVARGSITGIFTVLVEGDDHNEPIADAVRGILDGHIVLERQIAERGRYPAINVLKSVSRTMPTCNAAGEGELILRAKRLLATYEDMAELIRIGAYRRGSDPDVDAAIQRQPELEAFLTQGKEERSTLDEGFRSLAAIVDRTPGAVEAAA